MKRKYDTKKSREKRDRKNKGKQEEELFDSAARVQEIYQFLERRVAKPVKNLDELRELGGIYPSQMIKYSKKAHPIAPEEGDEEDENYRYRLLKLPADGSIFHDGIPFHHFALSQLKSKHIRRLKENGIEIKTRQFSKAEDNQIVENWHSFAAAYQIPEEDTPRYMSAATSLESTEEHAQRLKFIRDNLFRPWMCARLLDRTAVQVFRRCYHLFRVSNQDGEDFRIWTAEDDERLLELVALHGESWEYIGNELFHPRYSCYRRYHKLKGTATAADGRNGHMAENDIETYKQNIAENSILLRQNMERADWSRIELARLYNYLADHLPRNPVLIATVPKYQHLDAQIDWDSDDMRLLKRPASERRSKWEELKTQFCAAKERLQSDIVKNILREVFPEDTRILSRAKLVRPLSTRKRQFFHPTELSKDLILLKQYCLESGVDSVRDIHQEPLEERFKAIGKPSDYPFKRFIRRVRYLIYVAHRTYIFKMLPIDQDHLPVHLELLAFILGIVKYIKLKKKAMRKYTKRFLRIKGWERRKEIIYVRRREAEDKRNRRLENTQ